MEVVCVGLTMRRLPANILEQVDIMAFTNRVKFEQVKLGMKYFSYAEIIIINFFVSHLLFSISFILFNLD